eukprot:2228135-Prymnesium_polylepis.1
MGRRRGRAAPSHSGCWSAAPRGWRGAACGTKYSIQYEPETGALDTAFGDNIGHRPQEHCGTVTSPTFV